MEVVDIQIILSTEPCIITNGLRVWEDAGEDRKDKFVRELENCKNGMEEVNARSQGLMRELVLRLVWGEGEEEGVARSKACMLGQ